VARSGKLVLLPSKARNKILAANEIRAVDGPKHIKLKKHGIVEIDTARLGEYSVVKFHVEFRISDYPAAYLDDRPIKCLIERWSDVVVNLDSMRSSTSYLILMAKWRLLWVAMNFALYAFVSLLRIFYLGFVK
jgi:hypothetical protein